MKLQQTVFLLLAVAAAGQAQDYQSYDAGQDDYGYYEQEDYYAQEGGDSLYHDYAAQKQNKAQGGGGGGMVKTVAVGMAGWFLGGKIHAGRAVKKANKKSMQAQKELYLKYLQDVGTLQNNIAELQQYIKLMTQHQLTEEFLAADIDNDQLVSRAEYEMYKKQYLAKHPEAANNFPRFEEFDPDSNGMITVREHESYYEKQGLL